MFLSAETLCTLAGVVESDSQIRTSGNAFVLHLGEEAAASSVTRQPRDGVLRILEGEESFVVEAGQVAYLLTEETVSIPTDMMGFIALDTKLKFRGLDDVSGFHVSPGYKGRLIFLVSNESNMDITIRRNEPAFRLWLARLDKATSGTPTISGLSHLTSDHLDRLTSGRITVTSVHDELQELKGDVKRISTLVHTILISVLFLIVALVLRVAWQDIKELVDIDGMEQSQEQLDQGN